MTTKHIRRSFKIIQIRMRSTKRGGKGKQWSLQATMNSWSISHASVSSLPFLRGHQSAGIGELWQPICLESSKLPNKTFLDTIPWKQIISYLSLLMREAWQPTSVFLPGESHGQRSLVGYSPWGCRVRHDWSDLACMQASLLTEEQANRSLCSSTVEISNLIFFSSRL